MTQAAKAQEPSMEEILASIRRIITDDEAPKMVKPMASASSRPAPEARPSAVASLSARPKPLPSRPAAATPAMSSSASKPATHEQAFTHERAVNHAHAIAYEHEAGAISAELDTPPGESAAESLLSSKTRAAIDNAFKPLTNPISGQNAAIFEDLVKDLLRPMLKVWLDENLPELVERLVRAEIERVSRGR